MARRCSVEALGDIGTGAALALPNVIGALRDESPDVRAKAVEAIGTIACNLDDAPDTTMALIEALKDEHERVRRNAMLAMCRLAPQSDSPVSDLRTALADENRYVRGDAVHALRRINTPMAKDVLLDYLITSRWCPLTTPESTH